MSLKILSYTQHLEGIGHLVRSRHIAAALVEAGCDVELVIGGMPVKGLSEIGAHLTQLPPLKAGPGGYSDLVDQAGAPVSEAVKASRRQILLERLKAYGPDVVIVEAFPFGRRQMRFELEPFLEAASNQTPRPLVVCSVRDILQENKKPGRVDETVKHLRTYFDLVLTHGDKNFVSLSATFPAADQIADLIQYTGIVAGKTPRASANEVFDVVVSAGGGATGLNLLKAVMDAKPLSRCAAKRWCIITGPNLPKEIAGKLQGLADDGVSIFPFRPDLPALLLSADLSISQCGYNTAVDLFQSRCRAVVVPYAGKEQTEQTRRAQLLSAHGFAVCVEEHALSAKSLAGAIDRALALPKAAADKYPSLQGAATSAAIIMARMQSRD